MRSLTFFLAGAFIAICAKSTIKDAIYQIQGVQVDDSIEFENDGSKHSALARRKRHADDAEAPRNKSESRRQAGYDGAAVSRVGLEGAAAAKVLRVPGGKRRAHPKLKAGRIGTNGTRYYYPERRPLPLPTCFHNPTGYVCCNEVLNDLMVETYFKLEQRPKFHACNIQLIATHLQLNAQSFFNTSFETIVSYDDFAQKIRFRGNMVCKIELASTFILAYATASDAYNHDLNGHRREKRAANGEFEWSSGTSDSWHSVHSSFI